MKLEDCLIKTIDNRGRNPKQYSDASGHPIIDNFLIKNTLYPDLKSVTRYIDEDTYRNFLRGYVHRNMPIMTLVGNGIANVTLAPSDDVAIIQNTIGFQVNEKMDELYLYYYLLSRQDEIKNFDRGSGQPSIRKTDVLGLEIELPPLDIQKKIASLLYSLDLKIEENKKINNNLAA